MGMGSDPPAPGEFVLAGPRLICVGGADLSGPVELPLLWSGWLGPIPVFPIGWHAAHFQRPKNNCVSARVGCSGPRRFSPAGLVCFRGWSGAGFPGHPGCPSRRARSSHSGWLGRRLPLRPGVAYLGSSTLWLRRGPVRGNHHGYGLALSRAWVGYLGPDQGGLRALGLGVSLQSAMPGLTDCRAVTARRRIDLPLEHNGLRRSVRCLPCVVPGLRHRRRSGRGLRCVVLGLCRGRRSGRSVRCVVRGLWCGWRSGRGLRYLVVELHRG
jgi:hypothetical protein